MGTNRIVKGKIESYAYENVFSFVDNRSYVSDPRSPSSTNDRTFVYDSDPLAKSLNFGDFPYIIIDLPRLEQNSPSSDVKHINTEWSLVITVRSAKDGASNGSTSLGKNDILTIGDDLNDLFDQRARQQEFQDLNMYNINLVKESTDTLFIQDKPVYEATYTLTFRTRLEVSD